MNVPTKRFGRTEVQMPVLTCGGMRYQQGWDDLEPNTIDAKVQQNLEACIHHALDCGINHIETARGYGPSEMQLGWVLPKIERERLLVQTKIGVKDSAAEFLRVFEVSMNYLQLDHVDFLSVHGINTLEQLETVLKPGGMLAAMRQLQKEGRVRFCGFSTHAGPEVVVPACETGEFDYVNLHWYFIYNQLNWSMVAAANKQDMGVFIISPNDKGGMLYQPTETMQRLCAPLTPMQWHDLYCLNKPEVHTLSIGAAKPSDFDEHVRAVTEFWKDRAALADSIESRIVGHMESELGADWVQRWPEGLPHHSEIPGQVNVREVLRLWTFFKGGVIGEFARTRYNMLGSAGEWFPGQKIPERVSNGAGLGVENSPFADRIPDLLTEAHALFNRDQEVKRLSES